jgi:hypothetical protein
MYNDAFSRRFKIEWLLHASTLWHYSLDPFRCLKLGASFPIPGCSMNVTDDRPSRIVTHLREPD